MAFLPQRINELVEEVSLQSVGGPQFSTTVVTTAAGGEQRNINWSASRGRWEFGDRIVNRDELDALLDHFQEAAGKGNSFPFKDFADYRVKPGQGAAKLTPVGLKLVKLYGTGLTIRERIIVLPRDFEVRVDGEVREASVDPITGVLSIVGGADPALITWTGDFDVKVRFDTDQLQHRFEAIDVDTEEALFYLFSLPVIELK